MKPFPFPPTIQTIFEEFIPICQKLAGDQRYAISVGGSLGKGTWDSRSDIDFRLFVDQAVSRQETGRWAECDAAIERWKERGINIDGVWQRTIADINTALDSWLSGEVKPVPVVWTVWGYHILPDIANQYIIEDPYQVIAGWKRRLSTYPPDLKQAILKKYLASLRYWRSDYHYTNKVERSDPVFLAGISAKLVHEIIQILFALNEVYFVGDGSNLHFTASFPILPADFSTRVQAILYPPRSDDTQVQTAMHSQYTELLALIDDVIALAGE